MAARSRFAASAALLLFAAALVLFGWWSIQLVEQVGTLRDAVATRVNWLSAVEATRQDVRVADSTNALLRPAQLVGRVADELAAEGLPDLAAAAAGAEHRLMRLSQASDGDIPSADRKAVETKLAERLDAVPNRCLDKPFSQAELLAAIGDITRA